MAATIRDVAQLAKVSVSTVSRILRDDQKNGFTASPQTRARVLDAATALGYRPNTAARAMVGGRTGLVGIVIGLVSESFLERILAGVQSSADERGLAVVLYTHHSGKNGEERMLNALQARRLDGLIAAHCDLPRGILKELKRLDTPVVFISPHTMPGYAAVKVDDEAGGRLAGAHLVAQGHREVAFLGYESVHSQARQRGLKQALSAHQVHLRSVIAPETGPSLHAEPWHDTEIIAQDILKRYPQTTAVVCSDDYGAVGVLAAARQLGLRVPNELSLIGYDDLFWTAFTEPPLTTVQQPKEEQGVQAMRLLDELWRGEKPREIVLMPQLTVRKSTARAFSRKMQGVTS